MKIKQYVGSSLLLAIGSSYDTIWRDLNSKLKKEQCNLLQALILISLLFERTESVTPSTLADIFHTTRGNVSHCISHLEKRGLLKRVLYEKDARSYRLLLKPEGKKLALRLMKIIDDLETFFERQFGKQNVLDTIANIHSLGAAYIKREGTISGRSIKRPRHLATAEPRISI